MTRDELKRIEERAEKATKGSWCYEECGETFVVGTAFDENDQPVRGRANEIDIPGTHIAELELLEAPGNQEADARFIAHAREDIPALLAYIRELEEER